jgi:hypothetical protein
VVEGLCSRYSLLWVEGQQTRQKIEALLGQDASIAEGVVEKFFAKTGSERKRMEEDVRKGRKEERRRKARSRPTTQRTEKSEEQNELFGFCCEVDFFV